MRLIKPTVITNRTKPIVTGFAETDLINTGTVPIISVAIIAVTMRNGLAAISLLFNIHISF